MVPPLLFWMLSAQPGTVPLLEMLLAGLGVIGALIELMRYLRDGFRERVREHIVWAETHSRAQEQRIQLLEQVVFLSRGPDEDDDPKNGVH